MRTITTKIMSAVALFAIMMTAESCNKKSEPQGYMTVNMTDGPADYKAINVEIIGMAAHTQHKGWVNFPVRTGVYNLLEFQNNAMVVLAHNAQVPIGKIDQLQLRLGSRNSIVIDDMEFKLIIPSGAETGLKININETITDREHAQIILDFDAKASIIQVGKGNYHLKPVIKLKTDNPLINN